MKLIDVIYYYIFKFYYQRGSYHNDIPWFTASSLLSISLNLYIISVYIIYKYLKLGYFQESINIEIGLPFNLFLFFVLIIYFKKGNRYMQIYNKYEASSNLAHGIAAWAFVVGGLILYIITVILKANSI